MLLSSRCEVEADKATASAVPDTNDSARCVRIGIGRSESVAAGRWRDGVTCPHWDETTVWKNGYRTDRIFRHCLVEHLLGRRPII